MAMPNQNQQKQQAPHTAKQSPPPPAKNPDTTSLLKATTKWQMIQYGMNLVVFLQLNRQIIHFSQS